MKLSPVYNFLSSLQDHNNREWFKANDASYRLAASAFAEFVQELIVRINEFDSSIGQPEVKDCIFRIYRDVRFSHNKDPYKTHFGAYMARGGKKGNLAGYYVHLQQGNTFVGGGIYMPSPEILKAIRTEIYYNAEELKEIMRATEFQKHFDGIYSEKLKICPKGFPKEFPDVGMLVYKGYAVVHYLNDETMNSNSVVDKVTAVYRAQRDFNAYLNTAIENAM